jgi:2-oxoglutarate ferredoxin oxidoreductase subunit alpha
MSQPLKSINDFVVKFANVNGTGSASANLLFAKSILRMGVPIAPRNIFPSNIQGLPTWYEVRVSERGHLGCRGGVDFMVAMNPQTWDQDIASIEPGGYLLYDSTKPLPASKFRSDITVFGVPLMEICNREPGDARQHQLLKNVLYVGVLSALLDIELEVLDQLIAEEFKGKAKLIAPNQKTLRLGRSTRSITLPVRSDSGSSGPMGSASASSSMATRRRRSVHCTAVRRWRPGTRSPLPPRWRKHSCTMPSGCASMPRASANTR